MSDAETGNRILDMSGLRDSDRDRYLASLLTPAAQRGAVAALYAFNAEIARIRDVVREPLPGEVRLQYWRDLLQGAAHGATEANPIAAFAQVFPAQVEAVAERPFGYFHKYAFNTLRQFGANFELLASHLTWLSPSRFENAAAQALKISETAKTVQFQLARAVTRKKFDPLRSALDPAAEAWDKLVGELGKTLA